MKNIPELVNNKTFNTIVSFIYLIFKYKLLFIYIYNYFI